MSIHSIHMRRVVHIRRRAHIRRTAIVGKILLPSRRRDWWLPMRHRGQVVIHFDQVSGLSPFKIQPRVASMGAMRVGGSIYGQDQKPHALLGGHLGFFGKVGKISRARRFAGVGWVQLLET